MTYLRLTLLVLIFSAVTLHAQEHSQSPLFNGREYLRFPFYINKGIPYFISDTLSRGNLTYDGREFTNVLLIYDQVIDELITYDVTGKHLIKLVRQKVEKFSIYNTDFIQHENKYYEVVTEGSIRKLKKEIKVLKEKIDGSERILFITSLVKFYPYPKYEKAIATSKQQDTSVVLKPAQYVKPARPQSAADEEDLIGSLREGKVSVLEDVTVYADKLSNTRTTQMGVQKVDISTIKRIPSVLGEADVLRVVTSLPGVKTVGEASTGLNVRGGAVDQNLILFNDATIYNPSHFFGMFSAFNTDLVKDITLYKSSMPPKYGGRLSSVLDIKGREGNKNDFHGTAGIGPVTSRITIEGPILKDKTSFVFGGRTTYANWLMKLLPDEYKNSHAGFYDLNILLDHDLGKNNSLTFTGYFSKDRFNLNSDTVFSYNNRSINLKWKHTFHNKLNSTLSGGSDAYYYRIMSDRNPISAYSLKFSIEQYYLRMHFNYYVSANHSVDFGFNTIRYVMSPGAYTPLGENSLVMPRVIEREHALESALYVNDKYDITSSTTIEAGLRFSIFNFLGPRDVNIYVEGVPKSERTVTGSKSYSRGEFIKTYGGPEYRVSIRQMLGLYTSVKAAFNTQRQYIHMLSNTAAMAPTDIWKLSDPNIRPQHGSQISLGVYRNFKSNTIEASAEIYLKKIRDYLDYKSGANLIVNPLIEADVINTRGSSYGVELMLKKTIGKLNGWIGYTWSRILLQQDDSLAGEIINEGKEYPANYDKPHDFTFIGNYRINHRFSLSLSASYSTGRPITLPIGRYHYAGSYRTLYDKRNQHRIPDYFRTDFSMNIDGNHKKKQQTHNSWTLGVYNLTGRKNPYSVYYISEDGVINGYKLSIFGSAIPFLSFNIRF